MSADHRESVPGALRAQLQESLGDAYTIERELGGGGMSRVFVAHERALDRRVVVKVLPHELAAGMNSERFRREIQLVAGLQHPHIVPVLAAGEASGAPFYIMPFIDGESLRARRSRHERFELGHAVHVLQDVIDALAYAHERGIVHRDIKPDNILMSAQHAVVTDFGVAKALRAANVAFRDIDRSGTGAGMAVGTPAYMAPEQAAGDPDTDHRADIYAWGLLAYELLAGTAPFGDRPSHEMLAAHIAEIPEDVTVHNPQIPGGLAALVMRCLEKKPSSRPQTASEVRAALASVVTPSGRSAAFNPVWRRTSRVRAVATFILLIAALGSAYAFRPHAKLLDDNEVAVLPFHIATRDPSLRYLREGMLDLLAAQLTGDGGPRSADPRTILSAFRRAAGSDTADLSRERALELAENIGAGQLLVGDISGTADRLTLTASLVSVRDGRADAPRSVSGPVDSVSVLVDRLASQLLALRAGEGERMGAFSGVQLSALRAYLNGMSLYRRARFAAAAKEFKHAISQDSTFALAGLGLATAAGWVGYPSDRQIGLRAAFNYRARLSVRDQALLTATAGPKYPANSDWASMIAAKERYAVLAADRADAQFELGDGLFHFGAAAGIADARERAADALNRAIALDSTFLPAMEHLVMIELQRGDTARALLLGRLYLAGDSAAENRDGIKWTMAAARGDRAEIARILARGDSLTPMALATISETPLLIGKEIESAQKIYDMHMAKPGNDMDLMSALIGRHDMAVDRGRPTLARAQLDSLQTLAAPFAHFERIRDALFWDGDTTGTAAAGRALRQRAESGPPVPGSTTKRGKDPTYYGDMCVSELWSLSQWDTTSTRKVIGILRTGWTPVDTLYSPTFRKGCALMLDAQLAVTQKRADSHALIDSLDAYMRTAPGGPIASIGNIAAARLYERVGDNRAALAAVRRREVFYGRSVFLSTYLRDEARMAEKAGDTSGAADAWRRYAALRESPEPSLARDATAARESVARLAKAGAGR